MKIKTVKKIILLLLIYSVQIFSQNDSLEVYIIDAYVTPEKPHIFKLSFFTSEEVKTKIKINNEIVITINDEYLSDHFADINFSEYKFGTKFIPYSIIMERKNGEIIESELFELILPYEEFIETKEGEDPISSVLLGMFFYLLPSPNLIIDDYDNYFSLTKEIPIVTFYSSGYNYPSGNIGLEYTHIYEDEINNYLRFGYKHIIPIDIFEYISPGLTGFTNFNGFNGISGELSIGLFKVYDVFTVYSRYRFNTRPDKTELNFHEISIGLYSNFFTIDL
jgi:hypothetical protein